MWLWWKLSTRDAAVIASSVSLVPLVLSSLVLRIAVREVMKKTNTMTMTIAMTMTMTNIFLKKHKC